MMDSTAEMQAWEKAYIKENEMKSTKRTNYPADVIDKDSGIPMKILSVLPVPQEQLIVLMKFGSHLYGTDSPLSDTDYKGIYIPTREQLLLNKIPKSVSYHTPKEKGEGVKNGKDDLDIEIYSLHYFIELAFRGETAALDMLHAPDNWPITDSDIWVSLRKLRSRFYTKSLKTFVGYARKQAAKYGIKGSRLSDVREVIARMNTSLCNLGATFEDSCTLKQIWNELPMLEHTHMLEPTGNQKEQMYQITGKKFGESCKVKYVLDILTKVEEQYGKRANMAAKNEGIDWKAVSHALRAAMQVSELLAFNDIQFPLRQAELVKRIKYGHYDYTTQAAPLLEMYIQQCEKLSELSSLPLTPDRKYWNRWLMYVLGDVLDPFVPDDTESDDVNEPCAV